MSAEAPLALTMGDPAGIGGELTLAAWRRRHDLPVFFAVDDPARLRTLGVDVPIVEIENPAAALAVFAERLPVLPIALERTVAPGVADPCSAEATIRSIDTAVSLAQSGAAGGVVTNPINKALLYRGAGFSHPGHTEYLAYLAQVPHTVMMLAAPGLKVVPVTVHIPLAAVPNTLSTDLIVETARIVHADLRRSFGIEAPRLALAGLNPHAGEGGTIGREDIDVIAPAVAVLQGEGIQATGPYPADTMFHPAARARYDAALAMYHDQALIPIKTLDFARGVNITLGLPFVRTSPDHGTAYDIAGTGKADPTSLIEAIRLAGAMATTRAV